MGVKHTTNSIGEAVKEKEIYAVMASSFTPLPPEFSSVYGDFGYQFSKITGNSLDAVTSGNLKLYAEEQSAEIKDISDILKKIDAAYPAFKRICERPKSHLRAVNEVRSIDTVKRVGYESIPYLASHSEDWLARTASGLKPARLFSRVEDDDMQIYENRFVKTAIDLIGSFLRRSRADLKDKKSQITSIINSSVQTNGFGFDAGFARAVAELIQQSGDRNDSRPKQLELAEKLYKTATGLWKKYRDLHRSMLYKDLRKAKPVTNPLNETNILMLDKNYHAVFRLWKNIHKEIAPKRDDTVNIENSAELQSNYMVYCRVLCEYAAHSLGFKLSGSGIFRRGDDIQIAIREENERISVRITDIKRLELKIEGPLVCPLQDGKSDSNFEYRNGTLSWNNDTTEDGIDDFCKLLKTRESRGSKQQKEQQDYNRLKGELLQKTKQYNTKKVIGNMVIFPAFYDVEDETQGRFSDCMKKKVEHEIPEGAGYAVIALPKCQSGERRLTSYAKRYGEKTAFLPLTMFDINSYRRLQLLFLRLITGAGKDTCPCCGGDMRVSEKNCRECKNKNCKLIVTKTFCGVPDCKREYTYLRYDVRQEILNKMKAVDTDDFYANDSVFQYKDIVDLSIGEKNIRPVCPECGAGGVYSNST
jgi:hypothetical protein